jgi:CRISPR-associated protein Cmr3
MGKNPSLTTESKHWGDWYHTGDAILKGPILFQKRENVSDILLPMPADLVLDKDGQQTIFRCTPDEKLKLETFSDCTDYPGLCGMKISDQTSEKCKGGEGIFFLLNANIPKGKTLQKYLLHDLYGNVGTKLLKYDEIYTAENRIGIKRSRVTHVSEEGFLFSARHYRLKSIPSKNSLGYWFQMISGDGSSPALPDDRFLKLGGENRVMTITKVNDNDIFDSKWTSNFKEAVIHKIAKNEGRFKLYLITPGIFTKGKSHPSCFKIDGDKIVHQNNGRKAQLIGMSINHHVLIVGWDIVKECPKVLDAAVPAGSVYFFKDDAWPKDEEQQEKAAEMWFDHFNFKSICTGEPAKEGFGITLTGGWHV